ncbi:hypothetical protein B0H17DRAFT_1190335 [Mycena rosella]|uniref:Uncharacterized protein n=1 Tax=Mycena rosella TaxID=1033263 RepID=A0AAD7H2V2_MYCRO|nr:hypothetical protein B0H17DRAFT_1190335 [Mycena rosella]
MFFFARLRFNTRLERLPKEVAEEDQDSEQNQGVEDALKTKLRYSGERHDMEQAYDGDVVRGLRVSSNFQRAADAGLTQEERYDTAGERGRTGVRRSEDQRSHRRARPRLPVTCTPHRPRATFPASPDTRDRDVPATNMPPPSVPSAAPPAGNLRPAPDTRTPPPPSLRAISPVIFARRFPIHLPLPDTQVDRSMSQNGVRGW